LQGPAAAPARVPERRTLPSEVRPFVERPPELVSLKPREEAKPRLFELAAGQPTPLPLRLPVAPPAVQRLEMESGGLAMGEETPTFGAEQKVATRPEGPDVAKLAREVYRVLKRRWTTEREQLGGL
jgi:hypothetical protein